MRPHTLPNFPDIIAQEMVWKKCHFNLKKKKQKIYEFKNANMINYITYTMDFSYHI